MEDPRLQAFRNELNKWKKDTFFVKLVNEGDDESINRRIQEAHTMYETLMNKLHEMEQKIKPQNQQVGGDSTIQNILAALGPENTWTESLLDGARSALITDLFEYPLTFKSDLIDEFKKRRNFPTFD